jgi:AcrR family transcriptional regulator
MPFEQMPPTDAPNSAYRSRLLEGMAQSVALKGYADTTVADIVREAGVSKRTFYECFAGKAECLVALYEAASHNALKMLAEAIDPAHQWQTQIESALSAYLACMAQNPVLMRTLFIEILGLGAPGLAARRRVNQEIAGFMLKVINADRQGRGRGEALAPGMAMAIVGGINELILEYIEQDKVGRLGELVQPASALVRAVTQTAG